MLFSVKLYNNHSLIVLDNFFPSCLKNTTADADAQNFAVLFAWEILKSNLPMMHRLVNKFNKNLLTISPDRNFTISHFDWSKPAAPRSATKVLQLHNSAEGETRLRSL